MNSMATLDPYNVPLDKRKLCHLLRRTGFGASPTDIEMHLGRTAAEVVDQLMAEATNPSIIPLPDEPSWASLPIPNRNDNSAEEIKDYNQNNRTWKLDLRTEWMSLMRSVGLREKMVLFWHDHFVTSVDVYDYASLAFQYLALLRQHAFGNFKQFVYDIGLDPTMLIYLNGEENDVGDANENYARELLELFTMGQRDRYDALNYTQTDIEEIARALTGWENNLTTLTSTFVSKNHDTGAKSIFGRQGAFGYNDVVNIVFEERGVQTAFYICMKLYQEFVHQEPDVNVIQQMADLFIANDFQIEPVISTLLKSQAFYDDQVIGAKIKSPIEFMIGLLKELDYSPDQVMLEGLYLEVERMELGQLILSPPDVSGWPGYRSWISTDTLSSRWAVADLLLYTIRNGQPLNLVSVFESLPEANDSLAAFSLPIAIAERLLPVKIEELDIPEVDDAFNGDLVSNPVPTNILVGPANNRNLAKLFLGDVPWYEWDIGEDGANQVLLNYVLYLSQLPEFQLT